MVFSSCSVPIYLDPSNWLQQQSIINTHETLQTPPPLLSLPHGGGGGDGGRCGGTSSRPSSSMTEQARLAKISPQTETALKCPRCESTNTKFCYFNNYSLTQPRHFCKSCRRYWTIGGALRNVPVGGGCRRNKRSKGRSGRARRSSRSPTKSGILGPSTPASEFNSNSFSFDDTVGHQISSQVTLQAPIMPPLRDLGDFHSTNVTTNSMVHGGLGFPIGSTSSSSGGGLGSSYLSSGLFDQWKMQQFPSFSTNVEFPTVGLLYHFDDHQREGDVVHPSQSFSGHEPRSNSKPLDTGASIIDSIKLEESQGLNMARNFLRTSHGNINDQQWGANAWRGDPGFTSHLAGNLL